VGGFTAAQGPRARRNKNHRAVTPACQFGQYGGRASNEGAGPSALVAIFRHARRTAPVAARLLSVTSPRASARRMGRRRPDFGRTLRAPGRQGDAEPFPSLSEIATSGCAAPRPTRSQERACLVVSQAWTGIWAGSTLFAGADDSKNPVQRCCRGREQATAHNGRPRSLAGTACHRHHDAGVWPPSFGLKAGYPAGSAQPDRWRRDGTQTVQGLSRNA
jgi:hypothetical protein